MENDTNFYRYTSDGHPSRSYRALNVTRAAITRSKGYKTVFPEYKVQKLEAVLIFIPTPGFLPQDPWSSEPGAKLQWVDIDG